ncbi:hypothetical protein SAMN05421786_101814 [Chryseobacterium ureilyticum]|uniref:Uncharacterized protein n=1 Tax=Chryseobacterium ureilyticum TaxID=373668 RepID=A0A1N7KXE7_9FLAO|nr:hypothetical protein [Chryseobacterium ureilyticum]SIS66080.1 hypothetical protein SAMN05421786_101814 [Chryseobacterium ureilyticum]
MKEDDINGFIERNLKNFSVNSTGWNDLIRQMLFELAVGGWNMKNDVFGKEKFGELRCSLYSENEELNVTLKIITDKYSKLSQKTCEICGREGKIRTINSWKTTLCLNDFLDQNPVMEIDNDLNISYRKKTMLNIKDVIKAEVEFDLKTLELYTEASLDRDESFSFSSQNPNYYLLLKTIHDHLFSDDVRENISDLFHTLKDCEICGYKALHENSCLRCGNEAWEDSQEYGEKSDYIKDCQVDIFIDEDDFEKYFKYDRSFEKVTDHQILFTHNDLNEYEKLLF